jgi:hypothetical protein
MNIMEWMTKLDPTYEKRNKAAKELMRGCFVIGGMLLIIALAMVWEII